MILSSIIYVGVTLLLSLIDSIRIKVHYGKVGNINHNISSILAICTETFTIIWWVYKEGYFLSFWLALLAISLICWGLIAVRVVLYDPFLNLFRIFFKINPTMRLDYVSVKTSSYEDQHSEKIGFWQKRIISAGAWIVLLYAYHLIFKTW